LGGPLARDGLRYGHQGRFNSPPGNPPLGVRLGTVLVESQMAKNATQTTGRRGRPRQRAEQQRSVATRALILDAAIAEFAERGFEGASIRSIADRLGLQHPLITYHYRSKDILWRAAAEHAFAQIRAEWDLSAPDEADLSPLARLRQEYSTLFRYTVAFPDFHRFMRQETLTNNPRLRWVAETVLAPLLGRLLPQIAAAQKQGLLPAVDPILFHYMMVSLTATLSGFGPEMRMTSGLSSSDPKVVEAYWRLVDEMVFGNEGKLRKEGKRPALLAGGDTARGTSATSRRR
jgi:TetR/AcrR family transcriptional regulator